MTITSTSFTTFTAAVSGGIGWIKNTAFTLSGTSVTVATTKATSTHGGLFYVEGTSSDITLASSSFTTSDAGHSGAGFYI